MLTVTGSPTKESESGGNARRHPNESRSKHGMRILFPVDQSSTNASIDVVAVHGIGADPDDTWQLGNVNWLAQSEMLPQVVPSARIMRFGYESRWFGEEAVRQRLSAVAERLLRGLLTVRKGCEERPLIFVGHCFGGLVIQKALSSARLLPQRWHGIFSSTVGVVFLGTPHRGTGPQMSKGLMLAAIASDPSLHVEGKVLEILQYGNDTLIDTLDDFMAISKESKILVSCFWEQKITNVGRIIGNQRIEEYVVDEVSGCLEGYPKCGLSRNHFHMNKFCDAQDGDFLLLREEIEEMYKKGITNAEARLTSAVANSNLSSMPDRKRSRVLQWISSIRYEEHARLAGTGILENSGQWLLDHKKYQSWKNEGGSGILWLRGDPGTGKTKLASIVISALMAEKAEAPFAYFFCNRNEAERRNPTLIAQALVKELSSHSEATMMPLVQEYDLQELRGFSDGPPSLERCQELILEILKCSRRITLVIDALDECTLETRHSLFRMLQVLSNSTNGEFKCFVASRNDDDIILELEGVPNHYIRPTDSRTDIQRFIEWRVTDAIQNRKLLRGKVSKDLEDQIISRLSRNAYGMFLWVALQLDNLCRMSLEADIRSKLGKLPKTLEQTYDEIYAMISSEEEQAYQVARYALLWIMSAFRPLSPPEMFSALFWSGIEEELTLEVLLRVCHNMVIVDHELHVLRLNHLSVREYFEKHHFSEAEGHILASEAFLSHWQLDLALSDGAGHENAKNAIAQYLLMHWPFHTQKSEQATKDPPSNRTLVRFLGENGCATPSFREWRRAAIASMNNMPPRERYQCKFYRFVKPTESEPFSPLPLASLFGFSRYYEHILPLYPKEFANSRNKQGETVLMLAAREAHNALVRILVENGADINTNIAMPHNDYTTALQAAAVGGHFDTVQLLLQYGADINAEGGRHASALQAGAYFGHEKVVRLLHINGGTTKLGKGRFGYALHAAAYAGSEKIVRYLLEAGDDVNEFAGKYGTPLAAAVYKGHSQMIGLLLGKGADINKNIGAFGSAFHLACLWGNESIVTALLEAGANLSAVDQSGRIPLHDAVTKGQKHLLPLLIRSSKDPRAMDDNGWTALDEATWRGQDDIVKIFADHGIYAGQIPDDCILRSKDRPTLVKSALELAFHDMRYEESWFEYALPIIRFSFFYLQRNDIAHRACQEISARWGWVCDSCRKTCDGEPQFVCTTCHSTDLCGECFESREKDGLALPTCILEHQYIPVDLEISGLDLWGWLKETEDVFDSILEFRKHPLHPQQTPIVRQTSERF